MYNTISFGENEGGECHEIAEKSGKTWFDPFENQEVKYRKIVIIINEIDGWRRRRR